MNDDIRIWEIEDASKAAKPLESTQQVETEQSLEEVLVQNPNMLMPGLTLVGRQTPTDSGILDLLGVDGDGRLVVFELKREKLTRDAVAQAVDYCSWVDSLSDGDLADYIADQLGKNGIREIRDFESWYGEQQGKQLVDLRPTRIALVGLGADARAHRMVEFLSARGVDISLLTFHGYRQGDRTLLARQIERGVDDHSVVPRRKKTDAQYRNALAERARELGIDGLWQDVVAALSIASSGIARRWGISFYLPMITLPENVNAYGSHAVVIDSSGVMRVTFFPAAIDVCLEKFEEKQGTIPFESEKPPNAPATKRVPEQLYCRLDATRWKKHKADLTALAQDVNDAWQRFRRSGTAA